MFVLKLLAIGKSLCLSPLELEHRFDIMLFGSVGRNSSSMNCSRTPDGRTELIYMVLCCLWLWVDIKYFSIEAVYCQTTCVYKY